MSLKTILALTALSVAMMPSGTMYDSEPARRSRRSNYKMPENHREKNPLPEESIVITDPHKGHKVEAFEFSFNWQNKILKITCQISYGNEKSRLKAISRKQGELAEYIKVTPLEKIHAFKQFTIESTFSPAPQKGIVRKQALPQTSLKGAYEGVCNRTACTTNLSALYYNHSTREHYCRECAKMINEMNPESYQMYGHELCTLV